VPWYELDTNADAVLDAIFGSTTLGPASFVLRLWTENPLDGGVEVTGANLTAPTITNNSTNFPAASDGVKTSAAFTVGPSTGATSAATWWSLENSSTGTGWAMGRLDSEWEASGAGESVLVTCVLTTPNDVI
jgi:hypothetical protein